MLIQVNTTNGSGFWRAGIKFGPTPTKLWVGDGTPPDPRIQVIDEKQLAKIEAATGEHGPLFVDKDAPHLRSADTTQELAERDAHIGELVELCEELRDENDRLGHRNAELARELGTARERITALDDDLGTARERIAELEALHQAAGDMTTPEDKPEDKPRRSRSK